MIESNSCFWFLSTSLSKYCYSHYYIDWIKYCKVSWWFYCTDPKEISLIPFFSLYGLFSAFTCVNNIGSFVNNLVGVRILNHFSFYTSFVLRSSGDMDCKSWMFCFYSSSSPSQSSSSFSEKYFLYSCFFKKVFRSIFSACRSLFIAFKLN